MTTSALTAVFRAPGEGRDFWVWGDRYSFRTVGEETGGAHALLEMWVQPGSATPPHIHQREDECFYVLEGQLTFCFGGNRRTAGPGSFVFAPRGRPHRFMNESSGVVRALVFLVPAGFENYLMALGTAVTAACPEAPPLSPEIIARAQALAGSYGREFVGEAAV